MNQNESRKQREREKIEDELDHELEQTFPGSDPLNITRRIPCSQITPKLYAERYRLAVKATGRP